jgi:CRP-like cAMP-binding protein
MINEHVFQKDSAANHFYFINEGVCEVVASDDKTLIRFMSKGAFFGEIGCLLTGKRSCSVIARTTTILYKVKKDNLIAILEEYPSQYQFLKDVGRQRLETTNPKEIKFSEDRDLTLI